MRVRSGSRVMTIRQAIRDELIGGDFILKMSPSEFKMFQSKIARWINSQQAKTKHAKKYLMY